MRGRSPWRKPIVCWMALVAIGMSVSACEVTPEKIQQWKGVESGPRKLREAVRNERHKREVRVAAAEALVELALTDDLAAEVKEMKPAAQAALLQQTGDLALSWRGLARYWRKRAEAGA